MQPVDQHAAHHRGVSRRGPRHLPRLRAALGHAGPRTAAAALPSPTWLPPARWWPTWPPSSPGGGIRATWATVGFLFASTGRGADRPSARRCGPAYRSPRARPLRRDLGRRTRASAPEHLAGSLVRLLAGTPGQEVASHTFSHFYCLEEGQTGGRPAGRPGRGPGHRLARHGTRADQSGPAPQPVESPLRRGGAGERLQLLPGSPTVMGPPGPAGATTSDR